MVAGMKVFFRFFAMLAVACIVAGVVVSAHAPAAGASAIPTVRTMRIGLFFGDGALPSANLQNAEGFGNGFQFGHFDTNRNFVPIGASTSENRISMLMDRNMVWHPGGSVGAGEYREGTSGSVVVGAFHVQLNTIFSTFDEARTEAALHQNAFVKFDSGQFRVLIGNHTTRDAATNAMSALGLTGSAAVEAGTSNTITVVRTGTNVILFEFDMGTTPLGVMPIPSGNENPETWFRGFRYHGGFQYSRRDGGRLTVINMVDLEDYVKGILPYEMSNTWPIEALKAQALCARSFALRSIGRHGTHGFDLCVEVHCQVYRGRGQANERTDRATTETAGLVVTHNGRIAETVYASSNGGASENVENVWMEPRAYLRGVIDPFEADVVPRIAGYNWRLTYTPAQISERLRNRGHSIGTVASIRVSQYSATGNAIAVIVTDTGGRSITLSGRTQILAGLGTPTMRFDIGNSRWASGGVFANEPPQAISSGGQQFGIGANGQTTAVPSGSMMAISGNGNVSAVIGGGGGTTAGSGTGLVNGLFTINGSGNGHQVGMSQWGAFSMAHYHNMTYEDIIHFYFTGVEITRV